MAFIVTYGIGGWCENCDPSHGHPLHNIVEQVFIEEPEPVVNPKEEILRKLGLSEEELQILVGGA